MMVGTSTRGVVAFSPETGQAIWQSPPMELVMDLVHASSTRLVAHLNANKLAVIDVATGALTHVAMPALTMYGTMRLVSEDVVITASSGVTLVTNVATGETRSIAWPFKEYRAVTTYGPFLLALYENSLIITHVNQTTFHTIECPGDQLVGISLRGGLVVWTDNDRIEVMIPN